MSRRLKPAPDQPRGEAARDSEPEAQVAVLALDGHRKPRNRLTTQRRVAAGRVAMCMGATMMRHGSDPYLSAAMSGIVICMLLLATILIRNVGVVEPRGQVMVSEQRQAGNQTSPENDNRVTLDIGLRGSLP